MSLMNPDVCPNCGAEVPDRAKACPECGSCEQTGWSDDAEASNLGLPDDEFDYADFVKREFEQKEPSSTKKWVWWVAAALLVGPFLFWLLMR